MKPTLTPDADRRKELWLAEPEHPAPAHDEATRYIQAPPKVQALLDDALKHLEEAQKLYAGLPEAPVVSPKILAAMTAARKAQHYAAAPPAPRTRAKSHQGRAPRRAQNEHRSGSRRGDRTRASSSDDPDPDPEPRVCECGCGATLEHKRADARFVDDRHKGRAWRRDQAERKLVRDVEQIDHTATAAVRSCSCGGSTYTDPEGDRVCASCGRFADPAHLAEPNGFDARVREYTHLMSHRWDGEVWVTIAPCTRGRVDPPGNDGGLQTRLLGERRRRFSEVRYGQMPAGQR